MSKDITEAIGLPIIPPRKAGQEDAEEEEEERGRPRSRETPSSLSSGGTGIGLGIGVASSTGAVTDKTISISVEESVESPVLQRRELSSGKRLLSIVGLGQGD